MTRLPATWPVMPIDSIAARTRHALVIGPFGSDLKVADYTDAGTPVIFVKNIKPGRFDGSNTRFVSPSKAKQLSAHIVRPGDVIATKMGDPPCIAAIYPDGAPEAIITADLIKLSVDTSVADPKYVMRFLNSPRSASQVATFTTGVTRPKITLRDFKSLQVPLPPLHEQRRIAGILDKADVLLTKRRAALAQLDTLTQSIFLDMFGDPASNSKRWPTAELGSLATKFSDGPFGSNLKTEHYRPSGVRVVRLQNIGVGHFLDEDAAFVSGEHFNTVRKHECSPGDVIIATLGAPNLRACVIPPHILVALNKADCVQMRPDQSCTNSEYLSALLNLPPTVRLAETLMHGQTRVRISMGQLRRLRVPVPPIELQSEFARRVAAAQRLWTVNSNSASRLEDLFVSLQRRAFRGEL